MKAYIQKWGNSKGLRIPKAMLEVLDLTDGDEVELTQQDGSIVIRKCNKLTHKTLEERLTGFYKVSVEELPMVAEKEYEWGKPEGDEEW